MSVERGVLSVERHFILKRIKGTFSGSLVFFPRFFVSQILCSLCHEARRKKIDCLTTTNLLINLNNLIPRKTHCKYKIFETLLQVIMQFSCSIYHFLSFMKFQLTFLDDLTTSTSALSSGGTITSERENVRKSSSGDNCTHTNGGLSIFLTSW